MRKKTKKVDIIEKCSYLYDELNQKRDKLKESNFVKVMSLLNDDIKYRLSNSYVIDSNNFKIHVDDNIIVVTNDTITLIYKFKYDYMYLIRGNKIYRMYEVPEELREKDMIYQFFEMLINMIKSNPQLNLNLGGN